MLPVLLGENFIHKFFSPVAVEDYVVALNLPPWQTFYPSKIAAIQMDGIYSVKIFSYI